MEKLIQRALMQGLPHTSGKDLVFGLFTENTPDDPGLHTLDHSFSKWIGRYKIINRLPLSLSCPLPLSLSLSCPLLLSICYPVPPSLSQPVLPLSLSLLTCPPSLFLTPSSPQFVHVDVVNLKSTSTMPYRFSPIAPIPISISSYHTLFNQDVRYI